jgi:hypothetical protein
LELEMDIAASGLVHGDNEVMPPDDDDDDEGLGWAGGLPAYLTKGEEDVDDYMTAQWNEQQEAFQRFPDDGYASSVVFEQDVEGLEGELVAALERAEGMDLS